MRILLLTGKGGVGKTSLAAGTAALAAAEGHRTLVLSTDAARVYRRRRLPTPAAHTHRSGRPFRRQRDRAIPRRRYDRTRADPPADR